MLKISTSSLLALALAASLGCASTPEIQEMPTAEQLFEEGNALLADKKTFMWMMDVTDYAGAIQKYQDIIDNFPYSALAVDAELRIADTFYEQEAYEEALTYYRDFAELHPDHEAVPYTLLQAAHCHRNMSRNPGRDQTATRDALAQLDTLITRYPYSAEAAEAEVMWRELRTKLGQHVMGIGTYYFDRGEFQSASNRFRSVLNEYPGLGLDAEALYKLGVCYQNLNRDEQAEHIFEVLLENYEGSDVANSAQDRLPAAAN